MDKTEATRSDDPIGTPPGGGSWLWDGWEWVRNEAVEQRQPAPVAAEPAKPDQPAAEPVVDTDQE